MNFKKIAALTVAFSCLTTIVPSTLCMGTNAVYAASKGEHLRGIDLETNKGKTINIYTNKKCESKYRLSKLSSNDNVPTDLYAKIASNVSRVNFDSITVDDGYDYKIFKGSDEIDTDTDVRVSSSTTFKIKIYDKNDSSSVVETYSLRIIKESDDDDEDDNYDNIYLDDLSITNSKGKKVSFSFKKNTSTYDIDVDNDTTYVKIYAEPEYNDYTVKIDGSRVDDDDDWTKKVTLNEGKNSIPVRIKDDDDNERTYTLNITRASKTQTSTGNNITNNNTNTTVKPSPNTVAPTFSTAKLGWVMQGNNWYFVQPDGKAATGWIYSNYKWYYMDTNGVMRTGWVQVPTNNKWYFFDGSGAMLSNTTVGGYRLGSDGAWIQ